MSTSKQIDRICIIAVVVALLISILFMNGTALGIQVQAKSMGYEDRLFDASSVHTIDIVMDDWEAFVATAQSEEYSACSVVIDGEAFTNVGIRGKGNTSLSSVAAMDSDRYSFKIEFDHYDSAKRYYGLDKLCLNNLIQDNTMMKDYLTYQMMREFSVAAPLCSYVYITVNGEDWGLYLAVEAVEESFLQRNYGSNYGELYKPDSMDMGGGRGGDGKSFDMADFAGAFEAGQGGAERPTAPNGEMPDMGMMPGGSGGSIDFTDVTGAAEEEHGTVGVPEMPNGEMPDMGMMPSGMDMGSSDTKLQYIDDQASSYSAIFDNAKTDVSKEDQRRLIASLKALSERESIEETVAVEDVIRYFVVHNYVVNADSYTGSMVHNYYLYEEQGQLSMIPWDYNLAFGTFQGGDTASMVCDDIDSPLSVSGSDRPMIDWIFDSEEYTAEYHNAFREFLDTVDVTSIITQAEALITSYVEKDPTKFCTYEEFERGVETLKAFCDLRSQSIAAQLAGEDGTVDTSAITLSDMGTMNMGEGGRQFSEVGGWDKAEMPEGFTPPEGMEGMQTGPNGSNQGAIPGRDQMTVDAVSDDTQWVLLAVSAGILAVGLLFAFKYRR